MKKLFETIKQQLAQGNDVVLVTVIASSGSTPRGAGARMVVTKDGRIYGTIGGGAVEYKSTQMAAEALEKKQSKIQDFILAPNQVADLGMICGGNVTMYFRYIPYTDTDFAKLINHLICLYDQGETSWLLTDLSEGNEGQMGVYGIHSDLFGIEHSDCDLKEVLVNRTQHIKLNGREYYAEELVHSEIVYIFGGGHVAQELVPVLTHIGFRCVVADDRKEFSSKELFPNAERTILSDFKNIGKDITLTEDDAVCIMTRGHACDTDVLLQAVKTPVHYIGVMGSKHKIAAVTKILRENGTSEERIAGIHMPIGLAVKAETPAEIAVSIAAELILERAERFGK